MNAYVSPANLITSGNLLAGFLALILAGQGEFVWAAGCVGVAAVLDWVDGFVARRSRAESEFGAQLDSLADLVSFGVAPAITIYLSVLEAVPVAGIGACLGFVLCGAWRLARFSLACDSGGFFVGLPIPVAGVIVAALATWGPPAGLALAVTLLLTLLMVSALPFPTLPQLAQLGRGPERVKVKEMPVSPD
jgi:CDP-diacylglycerol---serine O-phosphatidyltransferase